MKPAQAATPAKNPAPPDDEEHVAARGCSLAHIALVNAKVAMTEDAVEEHGKGFGECGAGHGAVPMFA